MGLGRKFQARVKLFLIRKRWLEMNEEKIREAAIAKARELEEDPESYIMEIEEKAEFIKVMFLPKEEQIMGGGFELYLEKTDLSVTEIIYYQ
jgi:hypothetical protein